MLKNTAPSKSLAIKELLSYGSLAMPLAFAGIPIYIHAPDFYATQYSLPLSSLGMILLLLRFIDAVQDLVIGHLSDKYSKYRPSIILIGCILLALSFMLLFKPFTSSYLIWFAIMVFFATTAFSILTINLNTIGGLWSKNKDHKTTIASYREAFGLIGLILAVTLPSILQNQMPKERAFLVVSCFLTFIIIVSGLFFNQWQKSHLNINKRKSSELLNFRQFQNLSSSTKKFFAIYAISMLGSSMPAVLVLFFIRDRLGLENYTGLFLLTYFLSGVLGIAIWSTTSRQIGKDKTWLIAMLLATISFIWVYFIQNGDFWFYLIICILSGLAFGADLVLPTSILADHIHGTGNEDNAAMHFAVLAFFAKLALALATAMTFPYLQAMGFVAGQNNTVSALQALSMSYAAIPCLIKLISIYLLWRVIYEKSNSNINGGHDYA